MKLLILAIHVVFYKGCGSALLSEERSKRGVVMYYNTNTEFVICQKERNKVYPGLHLLLTANGIGTTHV